MSDLRIAGLLFVCGGHTTLQPFVPFLTTKPQSREDSKKEFGDDARFHFSSIFPFLEALWLCDFAASWRGGDSSYDLYAAVALWISSATRTSRWSLNAAAQLPAVPRVVLSGFAVADVHFMPNICGAKSKLASTRQ
jgi:hypothetical protein